MTVYLYETSILGTYNGAVDSQVKFNPRNNLIYGQRRFGEGRNVRRIITARRKGEVISVYTVKLIFDKMKKT